MSVRSVLGKSAAIICSLVLVSVYVYKRSGGELLPFSARESAAPPLSDELMPGPKSAPVWKFAPQRDGSRAAITGSSARSASDTSLTIMPGPKSAIVFTPADTPSSDTGAASAPIADLSDDPFADLPQDSELRQQP